MNIFFYQTNKNDRIFPPHQIDLFLHSTASKYNSSCFSELNYAQLQQNTVQSFVMHSNFMIST